MAPRRKFPRASTDAGTFTADQYLAKMADATDWLGDGVNLPITSVGGSANAITGTVTPAFAAGLVTGMMFWLAPAADNTGAVTLAINGGTPVAIVDAAGTALAAGRLLTGRREMLVYDGALGKFVLVGSSGASGAAFRADKALTDQTGISSATWTKLTLGTERFDTTNAFDTTNSRFLPVAGKYFLHGSAYFSAGVVSGSDYSAAIYINGVSHSQSCIIQAGSTAGVVVSVSAVVDANGTDYFELYVYGGGAGSKTVSGNPGNTKFEGFAI